MDPVKNCTNCKHHQNKKSLDDVADECFSCVHHMRTLGFYPSWEPVDLDYDRDAEWLEKQEFIDTRVYGSAWHDLMEQVKQDNVNSPKHYTQGGIETIDFIKAKLGEEGTVAYCIGNVIKYVTRWKDKNGFEDLAKARWYLNYAVDLLDKQ